MTESETLHEALRAEHEALPLFVEALLEDDEERREATMARVHGMAERLRQGWSGAGAKRRDAMARASCSMAAPYAGRGFTTPP